jgi:hypothetical protein
MEEVRVKALELLRAMKGRPAALAYVSEFVEQSKKSGTVSRALETAKLRGVSVAPWSLPTSGAAAPSDGDARTEGEVSSGDRVRTVESAGHDAGADDVSGGQPRE